jgi:alpha-glucosidase
MKVPLFLHRMPFLARGLAFAVLAAASSAPAAEQRVSSPDGTIAVIVNDTDGLHYRVEVDGKPLVQESPLGLEFQGGVALGRSALIRKADLTKNDGSWEDRFGNRRVVPDRYSQLALTLEEPADRRQFGLLVRAYDNGIALRYVLPKESKLGEFVLTREATEFRFGAETRCRLGTPSGCAESNYPVGALGGIKAGERGVVPLLAETPAALAAVCESDVRDWAAMFLEKNAAGDGVAVSLPDRLDKRGKVASQVPRVSPWRVVMIARTAKDLVGNDLVPTLATPSVIGDTSWIKPGASAWDAWWTGVNPHDPAGRKGTMARGTTESHKEFITFAAEMSWPYQLMDWFWYRNMTDWKLSLNSRPKPALADFTQTIPEINLPEIMRFAVAKNVRLWIWAHSLDIRTFGVEKALSYLAQQGFAGVKIDFINDQSQETVQWCENLLATAAKHHLMVDLHGTYHPTGLCRTYPNFLTQEGVLGEEYSKLNQRNSPEHQLELVFTRGLLGPMDYTPGGFLNRWPSEFKRTSPTQVLGTRARALALPVLYFSPFTVFCDDPKNYRGQPGIEFYRAFPTVWDDTVALSADLADHAAIARKSGATWRIGAINAKAATELTLKLDFLGPGAWKLRAWSDSAAASAPATAVEESSRTVRKGDMIKVRLSPTGGYAAVLTPAS